MTWESRSLGWTSPGSTSARWPSMFEPNTRWHIQQTAHRRDRPERRTKQPRSRFIGAGGEAWSHAQKRFRWRLATAVRRAWPTSPSVPDCGAEPRRFPPCHPRAGSSRSASVLWAESRTMEESPQISGPLETRLQNWRHSVRVDQASPLPKSPYPWTASRRPLSADDGHRSSSSSVMSPSKTDPGCASTALPTL